MLGSKKPQKGKQQLPEEEEQRKKIITKSNNIRAFVGIKTLMDKRKQQRSLATYYLINAKYQSALIIGRQLMFTSNKIWKEFVDDFKTEFEEQFFFRTSKTREHTEYLLDCVILCKIFIQGKKREDAVDILDKLQVPEAPVLSKDPPKTDDEKLLYNEMHEIYSKTCAVLLNLIEIAKAQRLHEYTQKLFSKYLKFVKKYYGQIEYGTALFKHANYLYENKLFDEAEQEYDRCIEIRKKNVYNGGLIDAIVNSAICLKELCQYDLSIQRIKTAIQITKDIFEDCPQIDDYHLLLAKLYFEMGDFKNAYHNFLYTYKLREKLLKGDPKKIETQLNFIFFYKTLRDIISSPADYLNITQKKEIEQKRLEAEQTVQVIQQVILQRQDFAKYKEFKTSKMAHMTLNITPEFFEQLNALQIQELNILKEKITEMTFMRGFNELQKCSFWIERKSRDFLIEANPQFKSGRGKIM